MECKTIIQLKEEITSCQKQNNNNNDDDDDNKTGTQVTKRLITGMEDEED